MDFSFTLTIAIPTYNRNEILRKNLELLLETINESCHILIIDNASDIPVLDTLSPIINNSPFRKSIDIVRNEVNIGGNANFLRCIEYSTGDYIWILGDDDIPDGNAIKNIISEIKTYPEAIAFNMYTEDKTHDIRKQTKIFKGANGYLSGAKFYGELIFISALVFRRNEFLKYMSIANGMQSSMAPQLFLILLALGENKYSVFSKKKVVTNGAESTPASQHGSSLVVAVGLGAILDYQWNDDIYKLIKLHLINLRKLWLTPKALISQLLNLRLNCNQKNKSLPFRIYFTISRRLYSHGHWWNRERLLFRIGYIIILFPKLGSLIRSFLLSFKGLDPLGNKTTPQQLDRY